MRKKKKEVQCTIGLDPIPTTPVSYNGIGRVGIIMLLLFVLAVTALAFYMGGPRKLIAGMQVSGNTRTAEAPAHSH